MGVKANVIRLILQKGQLELRMLLSGLDFPLTCPILQKSLFTVCVRSARYKWYIRLALQFLEPSVLQKMRTILCER